MAENELNPELKILIETVLKKVDGLATDVRSNSYKLDGLESKFDGLKTKFDGLETKFDGLETKFDGLETKVGRMESDLRTLSSDVKVLSGQFNAVGVMAIEDNTRITEVEKRVEILEGGVH